MRAGSVQDLEEEAYEKLDVDTDGWALSAKLLGPNIAQAPICHY